MNDIEILRELRDTQCSGDFVDEINLLVENWPAASAARIAGALALGLLAQKDKRIAELEAFATELWETWVQHCDEGLLASADMYEELNAQAASAGFTLDSARRALAGDGHG